MPCHYLRALQQYTTNLYKFYVEIENFNLLSPVKFELAFLIESIRRPYSAKRGCRSFKTVENHVFNNYDKTNTIYFQLSERHV